MKHRPRWNHLDLKQMHWLFSQQAFLLRAETDALARVGRKGFQPPALVGYSLWHDQYQGEQPRKLREDYEDEVSDRNYLTGFVLSLTLNLICLRQRWNSIRTQTKKQEVDRGWWILDWHPVCQEVGFCGKDKSCSKTGLDITEHVKQMQCLAHSRCSITGSQSFLPYYFFLTVDIIVPPGFTFAPWPHIIYVNIIWKIS